jgi:hypothetical protein
MRPRTAAPTLFTAAAFALAAAPATAADYGPARDLGAWIEAHPEDAKWLAEGGNRTWIDHTDSSIVVVIKLPDSVTADSIVKTVMNYDVWNRTDDVELSYQAAGSFFTGTKVATFFSPTVTRNKVFRGGDGMKLNWVLMTQPDAEAWVDATKPDLKKALAAAGMDHEPDDVDDYAEAIKKKHDTVAEVEGSHQYWKGYYRYHQDLRLRSKFVDSVARKLGKARQYRAALKAALYSTGLFDLAGAKGKVGVEFEARGNVKSKVTPGK